MRIDSSLFSSQVTNTKSEIANSPNFSSDKEDIVKESEHREENISFPGEKKLIEAIEKREKELMGSNTSLQFSIHKKTKEVIVKIIDNETKKVVKEIPPEKIIDMIAYMCEKAGIFVDKRG